MMNEPVSMIMTSNLITVHPDESMEVVLKIFKENRIHHLPIVRDGKLVGLITTSDLLWMNRHFDEYEGVKAKDVMSKKIATLESDAKVGTAAQIFLKNWFHALPIIDKNGNLKGIVTSFDVLKYNFKKAYPKEDWDWL